MKSPIFNMADLFCGAGGTSEGAEQALQALGYRTTLTAVNHWKIAVATHAKNHPGARHFCASIDSLNPRGLFEGARLDLLWASPECTHHSKARGGAPVSDQSRATAMCVPRWAEALQPGIVQVENVPAFLDWGPVTRSAKPRPIKARKGETFKAWMNMMASIGYKGDYRLLNAADYGDPTSRVRLFVQFVRGRREIVWPEPTHGERAHGKVRQWKCARDVIDWDHKGKSIFARKKDLAPTTMRRIMAGLTKYGLKGFVVEVAHTGRESGHHDAGLPLPTLTAKNQLSVCQPYIVEWDQQSGKNGVRGVDEPVSTICTKARHGVAAPFLVEYHGAKCGGAERVKSVEDPLPTIDCSNRFGVAQPYLVELRGTDPRQCLASAKSVGDPLGTITAGGGHFGLCEPFIVSYYGNSEGATSVDVPLPTVTTHDRFGLARPIIKWNGKLYEIDILFRMLEPSELAAAMGFPVGYHFTGKKSDVVRQIGNAVPCGLSRALVASAVSQDATAPRRILGL